MSTRRNIPFIEFSGPVMSDRISPVMYVDSGFEGTLNPMVNILLITMVEANMTVEETIRR